jgi:hypothetical protein
LWNVARIGKFVQQQINPSLGVTWNMMLPIDQLQGRFGHLL